METIELVLAVGRVRLEPDWPVFMVDWYGALAYAEWASSRRGTRWGLPDELAWEKAARGVDGRLYPWCDSFDASWACMKESMPDRRLLPAGVGHFPVDESPFGVRGQAGNVRDWCNDIFTPTCPETDAGGRVRPEAVDMGAPSAVLRVNRGGSWYDSVAFMRLSDRFNHRASNRNSNIGFRLARRYGEA